MQITSLVVGDFSERIGPGRQVDLEKLTVSIRLVVMSGRTGGKKSSIVRRHTATNTKVLLPPALPGFDPARRVSSPRANTAAMPSPRSDLLLRPSTVIALSPLGSFLRTARRFNHDVLRHAPFHPVDCLEPSEDPNYVSKFMSSLLLRRCAEDAARRIQAFCRAHLEKKNWRGVFRHRIWTRREILIRIFLSWRAVASRDHHAITDAHVRLSELLQVKRLRDHTHNLCPFYVFWLSGRLFCPKAATIRVFYLVCRLLECASSGRRLFRLWHSIAHSKRCLRRASVGFRFTIQKRRCFGYVFIFFLLWHRYARWKRAARHEKKVFQLPCAEFLIDWRIREQRLNLQKSRDSRAHQFSITRVARNAHHAIYQKYIDAREALSDMESSYQFYLRHIQDRGERAWIRYCAMRRERHTQMRKLMHAWYSVIYQMARRRRFLSMLQQFRRRSWLYRMFAAWRVDTKSILLSRIQKSFRIQQTPLPVSSAVFKLLGYNELFTFTRAFREWQLLIRRRKLWRAFTGYPQGVDSAQEFKQKVFYALQRGAEMKIIRRFTHPSNRSLPHCSDYSFDAMMKFIIATKHSICEGRWHFITETPQIRLSRPAEVLQRALLLAIDQKWPYDHVVFRQPVSSRHATTHETSRPQSLADIVEIVRSNSAQMRQLLLRRIIRDSVILAVVDSHAAAKAYHAIHELFSIAESESLISYLPTLSTSSPVRLKFFSDLPTLLASFAEETSQIPRTSPKIAEKLQADVSRFHATFRVPANSFDTPRHSPTTTPSSAARATNAKERTQKRISILAHAPPQMKFETFPIKDPHLHEMKTLKKRHARQPKSESSNPNSIYALDRFELRLHDATLADFLQSLRRFFLNMTDTRIDVHYVVRLGKNTYEGIPETGKHLLRRRINAFLAQLAHIEMADGVPLRCDAPEWAVDSVSAILTVFRSLKKLKKTTQYCEKIPFPEDLQLDSPELAAVRRSVFMCCDEKYPKLSGEARKSPSAGKRRSTQMKESDELSHEDVVLTAFLLPHIMRSDMIKDFLKNEVALTQTIPQAVVQRNPEDGSHQAHGVDGS
jgi:hypothetical protein